MTRLPRRSAARSALASVLLLGLVFVAIGACETPREATGLTKPQSPADGAGDYKDNPAGPVGPAVLPSADPRPLGESAPCPPTCSETGAWMGCGLARPRMTSESCRTCPATCTTKGADGEGWYDCKGTLIAARHCP